MEGMGRAVFLLVQGLKRSSRRSRREMNLYFSGVKAN